jgi:hypothetical protein
MRSSNKKPEANRRQSKSRRSTSSAGVENDGDSAQLKKISKVMGNQHLRDALHGSSAQRDALLQHIGERLQILRGAQQKEHLAFGREREWFKGVAKGADGYHLPDTTRWHESAQLYKKAGEALCNGQLGRGAQIIKQAAAAEEAAFKSVPKFVKADLESNQHAEEAPEAAYMVNDEGSCTGCGKPPDLRIADQILNLQDKMEATPPLPAKKGRWWDEDKEEEEEQEDDE